MATVVPQNESVCFAKPLYVCMYARIGFVTSFVAAPTTTRFVVIAPPPFHDETQTVEINTNDGDF